MNIKKIGLLIVVALIGGFGYFIASKNSTPVVNKKYEAPVQATTSLALRYIEYSEENLAQATNNGGKAVIFFHATWCPTCKAADSDLETNYTKLPNNVTILKADYDTSSELKTKYAITTQDTWVSVDAQGTMLKKWNSGGQAVDSLITNL